MQLEFKFDAKRYEDKKFLANPKLSQKTAEITKPTTQAEETKTDVTIKRSRTNKANLKVDLGFKYDASKYQDKSFVPQNKPTTT